MLLGILSTPDGSAVRIERTAVGPAARKGEAESEFVRYETVAAPDRRNRPGIAVHTLLMTCCQFAADANPAWACAAHTHKWAETKESMKYRQNNEENEHARPAAEASCEEEPTLCPCGNIASDYEGRCRDCAHESLAWLAHSNATSPDAFASDESTLVTHGLNASPSGRTAVTSKQTKV